MSASDLARKRAFAAWASRVQLQFDRKRLYEQTEQPALAAEGGKVKPLGAAGPIRPRGNISSGAQPVGTPVSQSQGLINSPQAASTDDSGLRVLKDAIAAVALGRGIQTGEGDPIDPAGDGSQPAVVARYPGDSYLDTATNALYRWKAGTAEEAGEWVAFYQALMGNGAPTVDGVALPAFYWDEAGNSLYVWDGAWNEVSGGDSTAVSELILYASEFSQSVMHNAGSETIDWALGEGVGFSNTVEERDTAGYWSAADPTKIYLPANGLYQVSLSVRVEYSFVNHQSWFIQCFCKSAAGTTGNVHSIDKQREWGGTYTGYVDSADDGNMYINETFVIKADQGEGQYLIWSAQQENTDSSPKRIGAVGPMSLRVQKL